MSVLPAGEGPPRHLRSLASPQREPPVAGAALRNRLRALAAGVTVVTVPGPAGFTATSFLPVSLDPPLVAVHLGLRASTLRAVLDAEHFAVHVLAHDQRELAARFARSGVDRFARLAWHERAGVPVLDGVPLWLRARVTLRQELGDHLQVVGEVVELGGTTPDGPHTALVHHGGDLVPLRREEAES